MGEGVDGPRRVLPVGARAVPQQARDVRAPLRAERRFGHVLPEQDDGEHADGTLTRKMDRQPASATSAAEHRAKCHAQRAHRAADLALEGRQRDVHDGDVELVSLATRSTCRMAPDSRTGPGLDSSG